MSLSVSCVTYLRLMGISPWVSWKPLPGAAASRRPGFSETDEEKSISRDCLKSSTEFSPSSLALGGAALSIKLLVNETAPLISEGKILSGGGLNTAREGQVTPLVSGRFFICMVGDFLILTDTPEEHLIESCLNVLSYFVGVISSDSVIRNLWQYSWPPFSVNGLPRQDDELARILFERKLGQQSKKALAVNKIISFGSKAADFFHFMRDSVKFKSVPLAQEPAMLLLPALTDILHSESKKRECWSKVRLMEVCVNG